MCAASEAAESAWTSAPVDHTATWIADVELAGALHGTVFAVGSPDVDSFAVLALGGGRDDVDPRSSQSTQLVLGKHLAARSSSSSVPRR